MKTRTIAALVIIDVQHGFLGKDTITVPSRIAAFIDERRDDYARVLATRFLNVPGSLFETSMNWLEMRSDADTALAECLASRVDEIIVKRGYGLSSSVIGRLRDLGIDRVDLCGIDTDQCVLASAFVLWDAGIEARVLAGLCGSTGGQIAHEAGLLLARRALGRRNIIE